MGKIIVKFETSIGHLMAGGKDGISSRAMAQVLNAIPGDTFVTSFERKTNIVSLGIPYELEAENDYFKDGTIIEGKYIRSHSVVGGNTVQYNIFDGITITDPPTVQLNIPSSAQSFTNGTGTYTVPTNPGIVYVTTIGGNGSGGTISNTVIAGPSTSPYKPTYSPLLPNMLPDSKCTCGAHSVGGAHSDWCDKKD